MYPLRNTVLHTLVYMYAIRDDYKLTEIVRQKSLLAILLLNLTGHQYMALEICVRGQTISHNDLKNVRGQIIIIISGCHIKVSNKYLIPYLVQMGVGLFQMVAQQGHSNPEVQYWVRWDGIFPSIHYQTVEKGVAHGIGMVIPWVEPFQTVAFVAHVIPHHPMNQ